MNQFVVSGPRRKVGPEFSRTITRTACSSMNFWMIRDTCTVGWTRTATVGKQGWLSTTFSRSRGTHSLVERNTKYMGDTRVSSVVEDEDRDPDQVN